MQRVFRVVVLLVASLVVVATVAQTAPAQNRGQRGRGAGGFGGPGGRGANELRLLNSEQVQKEIDLLDEQKEDIQKLIESSRAQMRELFAGLRELGEEERRARFAEMREKMESMNEKLQKDIGEILLPHQQERLKQIALQMQGNQALSNPEVAAKLDLSEQQKDRLAQAREDAREKMRELFSNAREERGDRAAAREKMTQLRADLDRQIADVLTADQKRKLDEMRGEPFELDRSQLRGNRRNGERGGRGRGNRDGRDRGNRGGDR
jgi:Spy/CpxP family protein refolding chaperone